MSRYELKDLSATEGTPGEMAYKKDNGCYVKTATGFIIAFLAIAIAVGVGLSVHFVENRKLECVFPDSLATGNAQNQFGSVNGAQCPNATSKTCPTCPPVAVTTTFVTPDTTPMANPIPKDVRLPTALLPQDYVIKIRPEMYGTDPSTFIFTGSVTIRILCQQPTRDVTLHSHMLNITAGSISFSAVSRAGNSPKYVSHTLDKERQFLVIHLDQETVATHIYTLKMDFVGPLKDDLEGFYLSEYKSGNDTIYLAVTQFESTAARKAFPCFDEPAMKATFQVTLVRKANLMTLSNMPKDHEIPIENNYVEDVYRKSLKMSTYLVAFVIGQFEDKQAKTENNLTYGAWARLESVDQTEIALDAGKKTIVNYEKYFNIPFPLPKQDMIALPDFRAGAMENWGLITYRESAMLFKPGVSSEGNRQRIVTVVTHELGHQYEILSYHQDGMHMTVNMEPSMASGAWSQFSNKMLFPKRENNGRTTQMELAEWFGDLVTMDWWDDLWLNEGFATFLEYYGAGMIYPEWKMMEQFVVTEVHAAFESDSLVTSHPIYVPSNDPDEIEEIFDDISYSKGGTIIRMMQFILGEETFKKGLELYLRAHSYGNANHDDLWEALAEQSNADNKPVNVKQIMDTWTLQMNYPVVLVTKQNGKISVKQARFIKNTDAVDPGKYLSQFGYMWQIPFTYTTSVAPEFHIDNTQIHWLNTTKTDISTTSLTEDDWIIGNVMQYGLYRVTYQDSNWNALTKQLQTKHQVIPAINRAQIINDAWSLARANQLSTEIALHTLEYLDQEMEYIPWMAAGVELMYLDRMLRKTELYGQFQTFLMSKLKDPFEHFGMDDTNSTHLDSLLRSDIAQLACSNGIQECVIESKRLYEEWMDNPKQNPIDPDLRLTVYCTAIAEGGVEEWDFALEQFKASTVVTEQVTLTKAMACTKSTWLLVRYLDLCVTPSVIRKQDAVYTLIYIADNPVGQLLVWDFVRTNWDYLYNSYGKGAFSFGRLIKGLTLSFNTEFQLEQLKKFQTDFPDMGTGSRTFQQVLENTQINIKWVKQNKDVVAKWLSSVGISGESRVTDVRLPRHLTPTSYDVTLTPYMYSGDPDKFTFDGYVKIYMTANDVSRNVTLHVNKLNITESSIKFGKQDGTPGPSYNGQRQTDKKRQFEMFYLNSDLVVGDMYYIEMNFTGPLVGDLTGLYLSQYKRGNSTIYLATTQFEPTDARKAFPCFDEPQLKAVFNVKLVRKAHMKSISNMPIESSMPIGDDFVVDVYNTSAKMSTYLLAFIVCDFEFKEGTTSSGVKYRAWARPESINQTDVALATGIAVLSHYEDYFGIDFPLPKQDMIAIPDFAIGAMENWGLITYRETAMLYEPGVSSEGNLQRVNVIVAHELAHQWFGDLVTMKWWDDLWLNEGFASFVEYMGVDYVHPEWKMFEQFLFEDFYDVMDIDSLVTSHPIYVPVQNPDEINEIFDTISYAKVPSLPVYGDCVQLYCQRLHALNGPSLDHCCTSKNMFKFRNKRNIYKVMNQGWFCIKNDPFFLGENTFKLGVQQYLKNRKFQNADHNDLWSALEKQAQTDNKQIKIRDILDTWILQMNYPVVTVTMSGDGNIQIKQERFLKNKEASDPEKYTSKFGYQWKIPFTFTSDSNPRFNQSGSDVIWLDTPSKEISTKFPSGWIIGNVQQYGVYRVNYDEANWKKLIEQLNKDHTVIDVINRGQIINDAFGLATAKQLPMEIALQTVDYLNSEVEYLPWVAAESELGYLRSMIEESELYGAFQRYMKKKVSDQYNRLGLNDTASPHLESYLRSLIASSACFYGNTDCINSAKQLFNTFMKQPNDNPIDPGLKSTVYCTAVREGGEAEWNFVYDQYLTATVEAEKSRMLSAMSCTRQIWIIHRLLLMAMDEQIIRKQDAYKVFINVGGNPIGRSIAWNFFRSNWNDIYETYGKGTFSLTDIIEGVTDSFNTEFQLQQLKDFQKAHPDMGSGTRAYTQAIENTQSNIQWVKENYDIVSNWLSTYKYL